MRRLRVLTYNIHKGFTTTSLAYVLDGIKRSIEEIHADLVFLQEVTGHPAPKTSQFEFIADRLWPHFAYGKNAIYTRGHHGNAILSKYPIVRHENIDVSNSRFERRGILHGEIELGKRQPALHVICLHLDLFENGRRSQITRLCKRVSSHVPADAPLIIAGDFNDWRQTASPILAAELGLEEAFVKAHGEHARSFPVWLPALRLDRIYYRGLELLSAETLSKAPWTSLSDHAALTAELKL